MGILSASFLSTSSFGTSSSHLQVPGLLGCLLLTPLMCSLGTGRSQENDLENPKRGIGKKASSCPSKTRGGLGYGFSCKHGIRKDAHSDRPDRVGHREMSVASHDLVESTLRWEANPDTAKDCPSLRHRSPKRCQKQGFHRGLAKEVAGGYGRVARCRPEGHPGCGEPP